ncbi:MAG TPA: aromatic amino acid ammonia-lyase [Candidatus Limnocylindrales bacterium]|nr:aromatic amino acid ammonia-lyase [Candidatus Limnocylindrales bacterium]
MTVLLTGRDLTRDELVRVARGSEPVALDERARARMDATRAVVEAAVARGDAVYGTTTGVGVLKRIGVPAADAAAYSNHMLAHHTVGHGEPVPADLVRGTMVRLANHLAEASPGVRPAVAERLIRALNDGETPPVRPIGSVGSADLVPLAELVVPLFRDVPLEPGEGTALLDNNAFATAWAALALTDAHRLVALLEVAGALSLEGFAANPSPLHDAVAAARPYPGIRDSVARLRTLLEGSALHDPGVPRQLQDPLTFRNLPQLLGAARDALAHADEVLAIELNANQGNPIVVAAEGRLVSVANFEILPLAAVLDHVRVVLASVLSAASERVTKGLYPAWSGLPTGLVPEPGTAEAGLTYLSLAAQSLAVEARLLAQPVSFELVSTSHAEGIEDRTTSAPLAARRLAEQIELGRRIAAIELTVASQAVELRGIRQGHGTATARGIVRRHVPFLGLGEHVPDVEPLVAAIRDGAFDERTGDGRDGIDAEPGQGDDDGA